MIKPILFNTDMVKAILEGRKTCTRRVIKDVSELEFIGISSTDGDIFDHAAFGYGNFNDIVNAKIVKSIKAPYLPGDILWVRETWTKLYKVDANGFTQWDKEKIYYAADGDPDIELVDEDGFLKEDRRIKWKPSIHMPKSLARIFLEVTCVRAERLQNITTEQILKEGVVQRFPKVNDRFTPDILRGGFIELWNSTIKRYERHKYGWKANPWVWVIEFKRLGDEINENI